MIETPRLRLRQWHKADCDEVARHVNSPAVMRWLGPVRDMEKIAEIFERQTLAQARQGFCFWVVERKADKEFLGYCGLKIANAHNCPVEGEIEIGWALREDAWGQGYAREAATASLVFAFDELSAPRVISLTVSGNTASWGLMRRLGMTERADYSFDDPAYGADLNPTIVHVIEAEEWHKLRS